MMLIAESPDDPLVTMTTNNRGEDRRDSESVRREIPDAIAAYARDELDAVTVRYTPKTADLVPGSRTTRTSAPRAGRGSWRSGMQTR